MPQTVESTPAFAPDSTARTATYRDPGNRGCSPRLSPPPHRPAPGAAEFPPRTLPTRSPDFAARVAACSNRSETKAAYARRNAADRSPTAPHAESPRSSRKRSCWQRSGGSRPPGDGSALRSGPGPTVENLTGTFKLHGPVLLADSLGRDPQGNETV